MSSRFIAGLLATTLGLSIFAGSAEASVKGRRNTTYGLGAATLYSLSRGKGTQALVLGGVTYYSYSRYRKAVEAERRRKWRLRHRHRPYGWNRGVKQGWNGAYPPGWRAYPQQQAPDWRYQGNGRRQWSDWRYQHWNKYHRHR